MNTPIQPVKPASKLKQGAKGKSTRVIDVNKPLKGVTMRGVWLDGFAPIIGPIEVCLDDARRGQTRFTAQYMQNFRERVKGCTSEVSGADHD